MNHSQNQAMRSVPAVIEKFEQDYGLELATLRQHWKSVKAEAEVLGWSEDQPFLTLTPAEWVSPEAAETR